MSTGSSIKVVVRCRPLNARELARGAKGLIRMEGDQTVIEPPESITSSNKATEKKPMTFSFDKSYWSAGPKDEPGYASQQTLYSDLGVELLDHSFEGFNTCIFAYGQTGSGKSYSMMGYGADKGIIPLTTSELFRRVDEKSSKEPTLSYTVEVSYIEIYNEKVRDLLNPRNKGNLRVREHPSLGPYVEDLSRLVVENYGQMMTLMDEGNKARTVASTNMNETSSRSHAVFTVILTQKRHDAITNMTGEKVSKISLVDLAGSERQASTGATGTRLKEGANINKSLTTLGKVIAALAQASSADPKRRKKEDHVPYRDSVLTWLLKESLGGNSKTAMIAAISPADYEETLSTLRYADAAKKIKTHAVVNEDPNAKLIRELKEELDMLRSRVTSGGSADESTYDPTIPPEKQIVTYRTKEGELRKVTKLELQDQLEASEKLMSSLNLTWEEKMAKTQAIHVEREKALEELGILVDKDMVGVHAPQKHPSLVNLNEDPLMSECLIYQLKPGTTMVGSEDAKSAHIKLSGEKILSSHCIFTNEDGIVSVESMPDARTFVNGKPVPPQSSVKLLNGFRVILGDFHVFRFNDPAAVRAHRQKMRASTSFNDIGAMSLEGSPGFRPDSPGRVEEMMDWSAARREVADIEKLGDQDLDKLFDDIIKVRTLRKRPESRMDLAAELESRLLASSQIEESQENPWSMIHGTTLTSNSLGTPVPLEPDRDPPTIAEEDDEPVVQQYQSTPDRKAQDAAIQQQHLTRQLKTLAQELKRTKSEAAASRALGGVEFEPANWTARELGLAKGAVEQWKSIRTYRIAETILTMAVDVKEANVIAKEAGHDASYNFLVAHSSTSALVSAVDTRNGLVELDDVSGSSGPSNGASVMIRVQDKQARAVYTWDMGRFVQQLSKMRHHRSLKKKPNYSLHFRSDDAFKKMNPPTYSFIGLARAPLRLLANQVAHVMTIPIFCQYTAEAIGSCRVSLKPIAAATSGMTTPEPSHSLLNKPSIGSKFTFLMVIEAVKGLSSSDFESVHAQVKLSSLVSRPGIDSEDTFTSTPVDLSKTSVGHLSLRRTISVIVKSEMIDYMQDGFAAIEFFAKVTPEYLIRLERFDRAKETAAAPKSSASSMPGTPTKTAFPTTPKRTGTPVKPSMRRCDTDFVAGEHHDILASVTIQEMASDGSYIDAEVVDDVYHLHQGLQRRLKIQLNHSSGRALSWTSITHVTTSDIRLIERSKGNTTTLSVSAKQVEHPLGKATVEYNPDGTSNIHVEGGWDTTGHDCIHLNRKTSGVNTVVIKLTWLVDVDKLDEPCVFTFDIPVRILGRDSRRSSGFTITSLFGGGSRAYSALTRIYTLDLEPPSARSADDLWRLDTSRKYVKGEEVLGLGPSGEGSTAMGWRVRGVSLIEDFAKARKAQRALGEVQVTKAVLEIMSAGEALNGDHKDGVEEAPERGGSGDRELVGKCVDLWKKQLDYRFIFDLSRRSEEEETIAKRLKRLLPDLEPKLVPTVKPVARTEHITKQGPLMLLRDSQSDTWQKAHFTLRRPYLHISPSATQQEDQIINLVKCTVSPSPDVELLLNRHHAFTIFTPNNSFVLQAPSAKELAEWIAVINVTSSG